MNRHLSLVITLCVALLGLACNSSNTPKDAQAQAPEKNKAQAQTPAKAEAEAEAEGQSKPVPKRVYFTNIKDGDTVKSPVKLSFGVDGMGVRPAGQDVNDKTTGHHHLIINSDGIAPGQVVPNNEKHIHYGKGQTSTEVKLNPGKYALRLQFADGGHRSYGPKMSAVVHITVAP